MHDLGGEAQDAVNAAAWLILSNGKTDGHSWLSLPQPSRQGLVDDLLFNRTTTGAGVGDKCVTWLAFMLVYISGQDWCHGSL